MARKSREDVRRERQVVLDVVRDHADAVAYDAIREGYTRRTGRPIAYSTVRLRLDELEHEKLVERIGGNRLPRFRAIGPRPGVRVDPAEHPDAGPPTPGRTELVEITTGGTLEIPLTREAVEARNRVLLPRAQRRPVTYTRDFLDDYSPGETWYLPADMRNRLGALGATAYADQPAGTYARDIMGRLIIDLSWGSSRLEGNRYSRIDTEELLRDGRAAEGASDLDRQMILNHKAAIEFLVENAAEIGFNRHTLLGLHALLSENLLSDPDDEGRLRTRAVAIGSSVYVPTQIPQVIDAQFDRMLAVADAIDDPLEQAFFVMVHLPYLQPFIDVNKRTSRLAANIPLIKANLCPLSFVDVPERLYTEGTLVVYEQQRVELLRDVFAWAYERSCAQFTVLRQAMGEPDPVRLRYRLQLRALVAEMVRERRWPTAQEIRDWAIAQGVPAPDRQGFANAARTALLGLRADIVARYSLRLSEFTAWDDATGPLRAIERGQNARR